MIISTSKRDAQIQVIFPEFHNDADKSHDNVD